MTPPTTWHPNEPQLQSYVDGGLPGLSAASVEAHLLACSACRAIVSGGVDGKRLVAVKASLDDRLDVAERPWLERLLTWARLDEADARALLAAPNLRRAWALAVLGAALLGVVVAVNAKDANELFYLLAPLVPLAATALAYAPSLDAALAIVASTPYSPARLLLARSLAVGVTAIVGVAVASLFLPGSQAGQLVWFLPAVALTALVLALAPRLGTGVATSGVGLGWVIALSGLRQRGIDVDWVAAAGTQSVAAVVTLVAVLVVVREWRGLDLRGLA
jgi:hypothetical protein